MASGGRLSRNRLRVRLERCGAFTSLRNGDIEREEDDISIAFSGEPERIELLELEISESDRFRFSSILSS